MADRQLSPDTGAGAAAAASPADTGTAPTVIIVCETCGYNAEQPDAVRPGKRLGDALSLALQEQRQAAAASGDRERAAALADLRVQAFRCLMACKRSCTAQLRGIDKIGYTLGDLEPDAASVDTLIDYGLRYRASASGEVPFKQWPAGVRGKFVARFPVLPQQQLSEENLEP